MSDQTRSVDASTERPSPVADFERARERLASAEERIAREGESAVEEAADAYRRASDLLDRYDDRATGTGRESFQAYVQLESKLDSLVDGLPADLEAREAFEAAREALDRTRLRDRDFEAAREALEPAERYVDLLEERETAREAVERERKRLTRRLGTLDEEIEDLERLNALASADLDAPVDRLRDPVERYNRSVRETFRTYRSTAPAHEVFALLERTRWYPLVPYPEPPPDLRAYVESGEAGTATIPELLEYADYSRSKLDHHVADPDALKRHVATQRTYLERLDAAPLELTWPPRRAAELRYRIRERRPLVARIVEHADAATASNRTAADDPVVALRTVRELTRDSEYERLRSAAVARAELDEAERRRLADGRVEAELESLRAERDRIESTLESA